MFSSLILNFQSHTSVILWEIGILHQIHEIRANITGQSIQIGMSDDDFHYCPRISFVIFLAHCILCTYHKVLKVCLRRARKNTWSQATYRKSQMKIKHFFKVLYFPEINAYSLYGRLMFTCIPLEENFCFCPFVISCCHF